MKFLIDNDVYASTVKLLRDLGHEAITADDMNMSKSLDSVLLQTALADQRIMLTRDRDYGTLIFLQSLGSGVIYLRLEPSTLQSVHAELTRVLSLYDESQLLGTFVVVEPGRHRVRKPSPETGSPAQPSPDSEPPQSPS